MADVVGYSLENPYPDSFMKTKNMINGEVEVFFSGGVVQGISPVFPQPTKSKAIDKCLDYTIEKLLEGPLRDESDNLPKAD